jgi:hypothetical protein
MQSETQLIIKPVKTLTLLSSSDAIIYGSVGSWRLIVPSFPEQNELVGKTVTLTNANGDTQPCEVASIVINSPNAGLTRLNFVATNPFNFDFRLAFGGYFIYDVVSEAYIDLYPNESISQNFNFQNVGTFAPLGDFSREFRVPASDRNIEAFGLLDSFTFSDTSNVYGTKIPAEIRVDTLPIIRGHVRVIKTFKKNDVLADFQLCFYGQAPDLFRAIGDKLLNQIDYLTTLNRVINYQEIQDSFGAGNELTWGLVDRGQRWDNTGTQNSRPLFNSEQPIYAADFTPFLNAWTIFSKIISEAGFTMTPTPLQTILEGYYCPWLLTKNLVTVETVADYYFNAGYTTQTALVDDSFFAFPELVDNGNNYLSGFFYAPVEGFYSFRFWANVQPIGGFGANVGGVKFYRFPVSSSTGQIVVNYEVAVSGTDQNNGITQRVLFTTIPIFMQAGERIAPYTEFNGTPNFYGDPNNDPLNGTGWELFAYYRNWGDTLDVAGNSPNIKQVDFVKDILAMHAAVIVPSRTVPNEVTIIPIVDYIGTGSDLDWTNKLDISKDITLSPTTDIQKRNFLFSYKAGGDFMSKLYTENGRTYGEYKILDGYTVNATAPANEFVTGDSNVRLTAESTPATYIDGTNIPIPKFINDKGEFLTPNLRFLFLADYTTLPMYRDSHNAVQDTNVQIFNHYSSVNASVIDYDLNFNPETPLHSITTNPFRNLFNEYWRDYLNGLYNPETRILEAYFALELTDILSFSYADRIFIKDSYWRIIEISDYKIGLYESVKVKLIKLVNPSPDCELVPVNVIIDDNRNQIIEFEDYSGNPQPANATCCARYGYTWDTINDRCMSFGGVIVTNPGGGGSSASTMLGAGKDGQPANVIAKSANTAINVDNTFSVFVGEKMTIEEGNQNTLAVGERLKMEGANRASALLGRNAYANIAGLHFGAGDRTISEDEGASQTGLVVFTNANTLTASGQTLELFPSNDVLTRLSLPDKTTWVCFYILHASDINGFFIYETGSFYLEKIGNITAASAPVVISSDDSGGTVTLTFTIDTATNTAQHRFKITSGGTGFPQDINANLTVHYSQLR